MAPDPDFLYLGPTHKKALSYLTYSLEKNTDFIQLTGEIGCGKTMLILALLKNVSQEVSYAYVVDPKLSFLALLRTFLNQFGLQSNGYSEDKDRLLNQFHEYLKEQASLGKRILVILDEAQNIEPTVLEELRMLSNLDTGRHRVMRMIFVGHPEFRTILAHPALAALKQRITVAAHLGPLNRQETANYIQYRLNYAGANGLPLFTPGAINKIFEFSRGTPRLINLACESSLLAGYVEEKTRLEEDLVGAVIKELEEDLQCPAPAPSPKEVHKEKAFTSYQPSFTERPPGVAMPYEVEETRKAVKKDKPLKKAPAKSKKLKIILISVFGTLGAIVFGLLVYIISRFL
jgi:general secretion pathway protein A